MNDDSGSYAVFTEQGSSASQMTTPNVMDVYFKATRMRRTSSRRNVCLHPGQNGRCTTIVQNSEVRMSRYLDTSIIFLHERNLYGHPLAGLLLERQLEKVLLDHGEKKVPNWEYVSVNREKGLFLSVHVDDVKLTGKNKNIDPMWEVLMKDVDLGEPTSILAHF